MKNIVVLATGGTIAGKAKNTDGEYKAGTLGVGELLKAIPELKNLANIKTKQVANIGSQDLDIETLLHLAKQAQKELDKDEVDGVLILHGSDTLEESAYFLNLVLKTKKPVVFTASMRSGGAMSGDGDMNIFNALSVAVSKKARKKGVLVVLNDEIHHSSEVSKTNTTALNAFASPNTGKIGSVNFGEVRFFVKSLKKHTYKSRFNISYIDDLPRVDILYSHFDDTSLFVRASVAIGARGLVHAGLGNGNIYHKTLSILKEAEKKGVIIVRSSRTGSGIVTSKGELDDKKLGFISSNWLNPQKARVLLMLCLAYKLNKKQIKKVFSRY